MSLTTNNTIMSTIESVLHCAFVHSALTAKRSTLIERIARYTAYIAADKALIAKSDNAARKYASRLRNHEAKLERFKQKLTQIEVTLAA
jgi:septal ring factor EnvC (AmiA/AmiB activator)